MSRDRSINNDIHTNVSKPLRPRRIEVINGVERRRSLPDELKFAIMAEAFLNSARSSNTWPGVTT